jgi:hypothetical protein
MIQQRSCAESLWIRNTVPTISKIDGGRGLEPERSHRLLQVEADASGADRAENRRGPDVDLEVVEHVGDEHRRNLRPEPMGEHLHGRAAGGEHSLHLSGIHGLDTRGITNSLLLRRRSRRVFLSVVIGCAIPEERWS